MENSTIITGQYVQIDQTPADIGERMMSRMIDLLIIMVYVFAIYVIFEAGAKLDDDVVFASLIFLTLPVVFYLLLCELYNRGQSLGIRVVMKNGTRPTICAYLLQALMLDYQYYALEEI